MNRFMEEYVNANFQHKGDRIHPVEHITLERLNGDEYVADKFKKSCEDRNNSRNRCLFNKAKMGNKLKNYDNDRNIESKIKGLHPNKSNVTEGD